MSHCLRPHESQHARPPCPSPTPGVHSNSCPSSQWCHPAISSSVVPFSCPQSLPASGSEDCTWHQLNVYWEILSPYVCPPFSCIRLFFQTSALPNKIVVYKLLPQALHSGELQLMNPNLDIDVIFIWLSCVYLKCFSRGLPTWQVYFSPLPMLISSKFTHIFWASSMSMHSSK